MIPRTLEPELMDSFTAAHAYDSMDHTEVNRVFVDDLLALKPRLDRVLDLGTGTGLIPIELCRREPDARITAVDLSIAMLDVARANVDMANLFENVLLDVADAKSLSFHDGQFDTVISNSLAHHLEQPEVMFSEAMRVCSRGGRIFIRDLLRPSDDKELERLVATYAADANEQQRQLFADSLRAALSLDEVQKLVKPLGCGPDTVKKTSDRHWTFTCQRS